jgi:hypothetical protein
MENKEYLKYQQKLKENKDRAIEKFYNWLIKHDINLSEVDSVIVEKKGILYSDINVYVKNKGMKKRIYNTDNSEITKLLEKYESEIEKRVGVLIYSSCDFVGIPFLTETMLETWEIDCSNI